VAEALTAWLMTPEAPGAPELPTLEDFLQRPQWHQEAACAGAGVKAFFSGTHVDIQRARGVCRECPVQAPCLQYALGDPDLEGVWAGTTAKERRVMRRGRVA
jgi:WhiB family redox-sensing transcriptional regulator